MEKYQTYTLTISSKMNSCVIILKEKNYNIANTQEVPMCSVQLTAPFLSNGASPIPFIVYYSIWIPVQYSFIFIPFWILHNF